MKVALVYDRVNKWGGAERVMLALHKIFPDAPLYTSVHNKEKASWSSVFDVRTSFVQNLPFAKSSHELYASLMPMAFESFNFDQYDLVISVTSEAAKGIITKPNTFHISYVLTPTRYLWSGYKDYFRNEITKFLSTYPILYLRKWDLIASCRPDKLIAISEDVKKRIKKYYKRDSQIIFPPILPFKEKIITKKNKEEFYLVVSRLVYYKRIDLAIKTFNKLGFKLKIVGVGGEEESLKAIAKENIEFLGNLTDDKLSFYYKNCTALIFPGKEDFGLVMAEAQSFGKPVIAYKKGGALDIIKNGVTGEFFDKQTEESLTGALKKSLNKSYNSKLCMENAKRFSYANFKKQILREIK